LGPQDEAEVTVRILNYTKTGRPFWNMFTLAPMMDSAGKAKFFIGVQVRGEEEGRGGREEGGGVRRASEGHVGAAWRAERERVVGTRRGMGARRRNGCEEEEWVRGGGMGERRRNACEEEKWVRGGEMGARERKGGESQPFFSILFAFWPSAGGRDCCGHCGRDRASGCSQYAAAGDWA
jgi:hypothetical protein